MTTNFEKVLDFHYKFGLPVGDEKPHVLNDRTFLFRYDFCLEELQELLRAHRRGDVVALADALADLLYVTYGLAAFCGIPIDEVFDVVHQANMKKVRSLSDSDQRSARGSRLDVVKPDGWQPPDVAAILEKKR